MKKLSLLPIICVMMLGLSCNNSTTKESGIEVSDELKEMAGHYNILPEIDTVNLHQVNAKVFQVLDENTCLATELSDEDLKWYHGNIIQILTNDLLFDDKVIEGDFILIGTYKYQSADSVVRTVKLYSDYSYFQEYKKEFEVIRDINKAQ